MHKQLSSCGLTAPRTLNHFPFQAFPRSHTVGSQPLLHKLFLKSHSMHFLDSHHRSSSLYVPNIPQHSDSIPFVAHWSVWWCKLLIGLFRRNLFKTPPSLRACSVLRTRVKFLQCCLHVASEKNMLKWMLPLCRGFEILAAYVKLEKPKSGRKF